MVELPADGHDEWTSGQPREVQRRRNQNEGSSLISISRIAERRRAS
jgi:hypothetical protein